MANEKRLIDANAMREDWLENGENEYVYDANAVLDSIDAQPTVDAVEVVHGRYIQKPHNEWWAPYYVCLECGTQMMVADEEGRIIKPNLCPNCGAKLDGWNKDG